MISINGTIAGWRNVLDRLIRCKDCNGPATQTIGDVHVCDRHGSGASEDLPEGPIVRALLLRVGGR